MGGLAVAGLAVAALAGSESARSFAKDAAVVGALEYGAAKVIGPKLGLGVTTLVLGMCSDQAGSCELLASEKAINERIKEFPGAYRSPNKCVPWIGWPCIEVFTGNEYGPGYGEARKKIEADIIEERHEAAQFNLRAHALYGRPPSEGPKYVPMP